MRLGVTSPVSPTPLHKRLKDALVSAFRAKERLPFSAQHAPHVELFCHDTCVSTEPEILCSILAYNPLLHFLLTSVSNGKSREFWLCILELLFGA